MLEAAGQFDILFEPVRVGPVTAPNRFYQTPHASGMGYAKPKASAALRALKAEGGWGVVCTEYCSIHPTSDDSPYAFLSIWDEGDVRALAVTADAIHEHGSLAGIELWHGGSHACNRLTREAAIAPTERSHVFTGPAGVRGMDKQDIRAMRTWQVEAARRARRAGFDIVYVYAGHDYLPFQYLSPLTNRRSDEYGGSLENRARLLREMIAETKEAIGDTCAVAVRLAVDELQGPGGITSAQDGRAVIEHLAEEPDLWDVNVAGNLGNDSCSSRFSPEGYQEQHIAFVKSLTTKPVVSVGRFTSPDTMAGQIRRGVQDFIGAARPSIADPFLPHKIRQGRGDEIRECIGCNICRAANNEGVPLRCTQNPTMGEEWRRGWHPERIAPKASDARVLVVGAGPAGLEAALALGQRGYDVILAEATRDLGGRVVREASLPGLAAWIRVRDYRATMIDKLNNVEIYRDSALTAQDVLEVGADHVLIATGSHWRRDGIGTIGEHGADMVDGVNVLTPDDLFAGAELTGPVTVYDDEHYFMGGALAERLAGAGRDVTLITPHNIASAWTELTNEQAFIQKRLIEMDVTLIFQKSLKRVQRQAVTLACVYTGGASTVPFDNLVLVTGRLPDDALYRDLMARRDEWADHGIKSLTRAGDCLVPSSIADAVHSGHRYAREMDDVDAGRPVRRERPEPQ
jgi:dimethylamine/trimethylamine dehydrogenase